MGRNIKLVFSIIFILLALGAGIFLGREVAERLSGAVPAFEENEGREADEDEDGGEQEKPDRKKTEKTEGTEDAEDAEEAREPERSERAAAAVVEAEPAFTLLIDETDFITGTSCEAVLTALYADGIGEPIQILDESGAVFGEIKNDGSGRGETTVSVPTGQDGCIRLRAAAGDLESNWVACYIHPEITGEMVARLAQVSEDLGTFVNNQHFADPTGEEALAAVVEYLLVDDRVAAAWENSGAVLYATKDSLMGSYGLRDAGETRADCFGGSYSDQKETYLSYTKGEDVAGRTLKSEETLTNRTVLHLSPLPEDRLVSVTKGSYVDKEMDLVDAIGGNFSYAERERAWELLNTGAFADSGFLMMCTHGKRLERSNGTYLFCFAMGQMDTAEFEQAFDGTRMNAGKLWGAYDMDGEYISSRDSYRLLYDYSMTDPEASRILFATTNYLADVLKDRVFDNTIIFFSVCHSGADEDLGALFLEHGAGAYISSVPALSAAESYAVFCALADVLGDGETLDEVRKRAVDGTYDEAEMEWYNSVLIPAYESGDQALERADRDDIRDWHAENEIVYRFRDSADRLVCGKKALTGSVVDQEGAPVEDAKVTLHRWLDHSYGESAVATTDREGRFEIPGTDWGLYGITAEKSYGKGGMRGRGCGVAEFSPNSGLKEPIVIDSNPPMIFSSCLGEYKGVIYSIGNALDVEGIRVESLPVECANPEMYICSFAFYNNQVYYCCKEAGTSDYSTELYVCELDGSNARRLGSVGTEFYIKNGELYGSGAECYDLREERWKAADPENEYLWGAEQFFTPEAFYMMWEEDGVYRQEYEVLPDGTVRSGAQTRVLAYSRDLLGIWPRLELATERYLFLDCTKDNTAYLGCYDMETGKFHVLDEHMAAGSGRYFGW